MRPVFLWSQADLQTNVTGIHLTMENFRGNVRMHFHVARVRIKLQRSIDSGISFSFVANRDEFQVTRIDHDNCHGINDTTIHRGKVNRKFPSRGLRRMFYRLTNNDRKKKNFVFLLSFVRLQILRIFFVTIIINYYLSNCILIFNR